jgi:hypothetical protein
MNNNKNKEEIDSSVFEFSKDGYTAVFMFEGIGEITGNSYRGPFKVRTLLDPEQMLQAGRERRSLLGQNIAFASDTEFNIATALSELRARIVEPPPFWNNGKVLDTNILLEVLDLALNAELSYRKRNQQDEEENVEIIKNYVSENTDDSKEKAKKK